MYKCEGTGCRSSISVSGKCFRKRTFTHYACWCWNNPLWHFVQANIPFYFVACVIKRCLDGSVNISLKSNQMLVRGSRRDTQMHKTKEALDTQAWVRARLQHPPAPWCLPPNAEQKELPEEAKTTRPGFDCPWLLARGLSKRRLSRLTHRRRPVTAARSLAGRSGRNPGPVKTQREREKRSDSPPGHERDLIRLRKAMIKPTVALKTNIYHTQPWGYARQSAARRRRWRRQ